MRLAVNDEYEVLNWEFKVPKSKKKSMHEPAIADMVKVVRDIGETIDLMTQPFREPRNPRVKKVLPDTSSMSPNRLQSMDIEGGVLAWIKNMPWPDATGSRHETGSGDRQPDFHFAHFYKISKEYKDAHVPHPKPCLSLLPDKRHEGNPSCPPPRTAANPLAWLAKASPPTA